MKQSEIEAARQRAITPAAPAATEGKADTPELGTLEAAPIQRSEMAVLQSAGQHSQESAGSTPAGRQECSAHGGADEARGEPAEDSEDLSGVAPGPLHPSTEDTTSGAAPGGTKAYIHPDTDDHGADLVLDPGTAAAEAAEAAEFAELESLADGPPGGFVTSDLLDACADFVALVAQARGTNFPSQPKMGPEWWTALYAAADKMRATGEVL